MSCDNIQLTVCWLVHDADDIGGVRRACLSISGHNVYWQMKYEGGVHRVKRIPKTGSKSDRIHTSTVTVAVILQPSEVMLLFFNISHYWHHWKVVNEKYNLMHYLSASSIKPVKIINIWQSPGIAPRGTILFKH